MKKENLCQTQWL